MADILLYVASAIIGVLAGEIFDVWYDSTHAEAVITHVGIMEAVQSQPKRPLAFGYAKLWFREVVATPDAFEHYHWGIWLAANSFAAFYFFPPASFSSIGIAVSLILDENRKGLADKPFGLGKPYFATCTVIGVLLLCVLVLRILVVSTIFETAVSLLSFAAPFAILAALWVAQQFPVRVWY